MRARSLSWILVVLGLLAGAGSSIDAQQKLLTLDDLYDPVKRVNFGGPGGPFGGGGYTWITDTEYLRVRTTRGAEGPPRADLVRVSADTGAETPLFDVQVFEKALAALPGVTTDEAARLARQRSYQTSPDHAGTLVTIAGDLYYYAFGGARVVRLTAAPGDEDQASFSPNGRLVAFVRDHDLFVVDLEGRERALTTDGGPQLLNGKLDWVYQEEIYGRNNYRGYWWSPDSARLAYLQFDETPVPEFTVVDHIPYRQTVEVTDYPKAGDPNPRVRLGVVGAAGGHTLWVDAGKYSAMESLIVNVSWTPDSRQVVHQVQDREQTWLDLNLAEVANGATKTLFRETTKAWVNDNGPPTWLKDGSFLWLSERSGWKHLYRYTKTGTLDRQITDGKWELRTLHGVDEAAGWIYFSGTERSHIGSDVYRMKLDGTGLTRLSQIPGTHTARFNPGLTMYVDTWSDVQTPPQTRLHRADGSEVRVLDEGQVPALAEYRLSKPEFVQVKTKDGFVMEAMIIKPPDFDPKKKYPVFQETYAGPHAPRVRNAWGGVGYLFDQLLAQKGVIVWICDNRSASGKGAESAWVAYKRLGETELADIEEGLAWLKQQPWVDATRVGINGWSYGGFMTSYALTHSTGFAMGIAGGSVTDWRDYDSIYTERYMRLPQNNPDGYARTAPRNAAATLHGELLLIHGTMDDNVHAQNTVQFAYELQKAGKPFELMLYPKSRHGVVEPPLVKHMRTRMLEFILRTLKPDGGSGKVPRS